MSQPNTYIYQSQYVLVHGYTNSLMSDSQQKSQLQNNYSQYYQDQMKAYQQSMMESMMNATNNATRAALPPNAASQSADQTRQTSLLPSHTSHNNRQQGMCKCHI